MATVQSFKPDNFTSKRENVLATVFKTLCTYLITPFSYNEKCTEFDLDDQQKTLILSVLELKVSQIQNEFMRSAFLPKCKPKIKRISALPNKQGS